MRKSSNVFRVGIFLDPVSLPTRAVAVGPARGVRTHRTRGGANEIKVTAAHELLKGVRCRYRVGWGGTKP